MAGIHDFLIKEVRIRDVRYLTVGIEVAETDAFHPIGQKFAEEPSIQQEAIHHIELFEDGTAVMLAEGSGDREHYEEIMSESAYVESFLVSGEQRWMATSQFEALDSSQRFLELHRESDLVVEWPIQFTGGGSIEITFLGTESAFRKFYQHLSQSGEFEVEVVETGTYSPNVDDFMRTLTTRQQEILQAAVDEGYYNNPREATHDDIAAAVGIASTTVGDHLREIEGRVFERLVR